MIAVYPRLATIQAEASLQRIRDASARQGMESEAERVGRVSALHSTSLTHASWPHYGERIGEPVVSGFREGLVDVARQHGFPGQEYRQSVQLRHDRDRPERSFDEMLASAIVDLLPGMTFAEASKMEVWRFLSLLVVPDVIAWRWPISAESKEGTLERFMAPRRHMLRWAWRRAVMFGPELDAELLEDEREGLLGRPEVLQSPEIAQALAHALLSLPKDAQGKRSRDTYRQALKRAFRLSGRLHLGALDRSQLDGLMLAAVQGHELSADDLMARFASQCADSGIEIAPLLRIDLPTDGGVDHLVREVELHRRKFEHDPTAADTAKRLATLLEQWLQQSRAERQIVLAAAIYFLQQQDARDDGSEGGFEDDLIVALHAADAIAAANADGSYA